MSDGDKATTASSVKRPSIGERPRERGERETAMRGIRGQANGGGARGARTRGVAFHMDVRCVPSPCTVVLFLFLREGPELRCCRSREPKSQANAASLQAQGY